MSTLVWIRRDSNGWILVPEASSQEILVGPVDSESDLRNLAVDLDYEVQDIAKPAARVVKSYTVKDMPNGHLFRIDGTWFRMVNNRDCTVEIVGRVGGPGKPMQLLPKEKVSEVSVTSLGVASLK